jgi:hypothetical protein
MSTIEFNHRVEVSKVSEELGLVFGYAAITHVDGEPYFDTQDDHVLPAGLVKSALDFVRNGAVADDMHEPDTDHGYTPFIFPLVPEIAKALGIVAKKHGLLIAMAPGPVELEKFKTGERKGFSIGGAYGETDFVE